MTALIEVITGDEVAHDLDAFCVRGVGDPSGMFVVPAKRGNDLVVPGSHGELRLPGKRYGPANLILRLWVRGINPDGTIPAAGSSRQVFVDNLRALVGLWTTDEVVTLRHTLDDGTARQIAGEVVGTVEPTLTGRGRDSLGQFSVALKCPDPFWRDLDPVTAVVSSSDETTTLAEFAGATGPIEDLVLTFGPQSNPELRQPSSGIWVRLDRVIPSGQQVVVDASNDPVTGWSVRQTPTSTTGLLEDLRYGGRGTTRWFALKPEPGGGAPIVSLSETAGGFGTVLITGTRTYKIA